MSSQINIIRGNSTTFNLTVTDKDKVIVDITGYTIWFTVRKEIPDTDIIDDTTALITVKQEADDLTDPTNGKTTISLTPTETNVDAGDHAYDIQYSTDGTNRYSCSVGRFVIAPDVTRG